VKRLSFRQKILLAPGVGFILLTVLLAVTYSLGKSNEAQLERIHTEYEPALALSRELQEDLGVLQRTLQEAVASEEEGQIALADALCNRCRKARTRWGATATACTRSPWPSPAITRWRARPAASSSAGSPART
jgi:hypothetical protein